MRKFFRDFKAFISRGNIVDMAIGVIIGAAFGKIVTSLVNDILMPLITWATGANSLADLSIVLRESLDANGEIVQLTWNYGNFIQTIIDFLIVAMCIFLILKLIMASQARFKAAAEGHNGDKQWYRDLPANQKQSIKAEAKQNGVSKRVVIEKRHAEVVKQEAEAKRIADEEKAKQELANSPTQLLKEIKALLEQQTKPAKKAETTKAKKSK